MPKPRPSAYADALRFLARRDLSTAECRARLLDHDHAASDVDAAIEHLLDTSALDDARVARAHARTAVGVKGRGRLRVIRELRARGIEPDVAAAAIGEVFGELDERSLVAHAAQKKLRRSGRISGPAEFARLYQHLMRQGFTPAVVSEHLRKLRSERPPENGSTGANNRRKRERENFKD